MAKQVYAVLCDTNVDGVLYRAGSVIELDEKLAKGNSDLNADKAQIDHYRAEFKAETIAHKAVAAPAERAAA